MTCESGKARAYDEEQDHHFKNTKDVEEAHSRFRQGGMDDDGESDAGDRDTASRPSVTFTATSCKKHVSPKSQRVARGKAK